MNINTDPQAVLALHFSNGRGDPPKLQKGIQEFLVETRTTGEGRAQFLIKCENIWEAVLYASNQCIPILENIYSDLADGDPDLYSHPGWRTSYTQRLGLVSDPRDSPCILLEYDLPDGAGRVLEEKCPWPAARTGSNIEAAQQ